MPNWCNNKATFIPVTDEAKQLLKEFAEYLQDLKGPSEAKFFGWFCPMPESEKDNWYEWNIANWGTKWDSPVSLDNVYVKEGLMDFYEDTAWSPPVAFYRYMSNNGFEVEAGYYEPGSGFYGNFMNGCDSEDTIPAGTKDYHLLKDTIGGGDSTEIKLVDPINFASVKTGDVLTTAEGTIIYVEHRKVLWKYFEEDNEALLAEDLMEWDNDIREVMDLKEDFYVVKFIQDPSRAGTETGIVFAEHLTSLEWVDD